MFFTKHFKWYSFFSEIMHTFVIHLVPVNLATLNASLLCVTYVKIIPLKH